MIATDTVAHVQYVCDNHLHGYSDNYCSFHQLVKISLKRKLHLTCQPVCTYTRQLLQDHNIPSREVHFVTKEKRNNFSDGHCMLEILYEGRWIVVDVDLRRVFLLGDEYLSASQLVKESWDDIEMVQFSQAPVLAYGDLVYNGTDLTKWYEKTFGNETNLRAWYKRICQSYYY